MSATDALCPCGSEEPVQASGLCIICTFSPTSCPVVTCPECQMVNDAKLAHIGYDCHWGPFDGPDMAVTLELFECAHCGMRWNEG